MMSQNLSSAAVVIGALRVKYTKQLNVGIYISYIKCIFQNLYFHV